MCWPGTWAEIIATVEPRSWLTARLVASFFPNFSKIQKNEGLVRDFLRLLPLAGRNSVNLFKLLLLLLQVLVIFFFYHCSFIFQGWAYLFCHCFYHCYCPLLIVAFSMALVTNTALHRGTGPRYVIYVTHFCTMLWPKPFNPICVPVSHQQVDAWGVP